MSSYNDLFFGQLQAQDKIFDQLSVHEKTRFTRIGDPKTTESAKSKCEVRKCEVRKCEECEGGKLKYVIKVRINSNARTPFFE